MVDKKKRRHLPPRGLPALKPRPEGEDPPIRVSEDFGEATFAGAFDAVKAVLHNAAAAPAKADKNEKRRKK